jgi:hypothetical protein
MDFCQSVPHLFSDFGENNYIRCPRILLSVVKHLAVHILNLTRTKSVPRSKHSTSVIKANLLMMFKAKLLFVFLCLWFRAS